MSAAITLICGADGVARLNAGWRFDVAVYTLEENGVLAPLLVVVSAREPLAYPHERCSFQVCWSCYKRNANLPQCGQVLHSLSDTVLVIITR